MYWNFIGNRYFLVFFVFLLSIFPIIFYALDYRGFLNITEIRKGFEDNIGADVRSR